MLGFFPTPYSDELLYSILARYYLWSANRSPKVALEELFGKRTIIASYDLPSNVRKLIESLPVLSEHTADNFIDNNTLYPYYSPFLSSSITKQIHSSMKCESSGDIHNRTGIMASSVSIPKYFRFCLSCFQEDVRTQGEPYWHRIHNSPGVLVCPTHKAWLQNSKVRIQGRNRHKFYAADEGNCISKPIDTRHLQQTFNKLVLLAEDIRNVINTPLPSRDRGWFRQNYQSLLIERGLATASGRIHQKDLLREFTGFYGEKFLKLIDSDIDIQNESNWLSSIVRKHRKTFHPIRHLLLIRFLECNIETFFNEKVENKPFGDGPWTCFNGASKHYLAKAINSVSISYSQGSKKLLGTFVCSCGFIYSTTNPNIPYSKKLDYGKIKCFGKLWDKKLKKLIGEKGVSFREAARTLKVDTMTVIHHAKRLRVVKSKSYTVNNKAEIKRKKVREKHRKVWFIQQKENPLLSKTEIRRLVPATYTWLYRNDKKWLSQNSPKRKKVVIPNNRVDWEKRDNEILLLAKQAVKGILNKKRLTRITISSIGRKINKRSLLEKHLDKMPLAKKFILSKAETIEKFQIRRIHWVAQKLYSKENIVKPWQIMRLAGIKSSCSSEIKQIINDLANKLNSEYFDTRRKAS